MFQAHEQEVHQHRLGAQAEKQTSPRDTSEVVVSSFSAVGDRHKVHGWSCLSTSCFSYGQFHNVLFMWPASISGEGYVTRQPSPKVIRLTGFNWLCSHLLFRGQLFCVGERDKKTGKRNLSVFSKPLMLVVTNAQCMKGPVSSRYFLSGSSGTSLMAHRDIRLGLCNSSV